MAKQTINSAPSLPSLQGGGVQSGLILLAVGVAVFQSLTASGVLTQIILATIADAYIAVTSFVAATLFIFYGLEKLARIDAKRLIAEAGPNTQVILAAFLGVLPGCGGAIIVITQYATGRLSFGAVLAVLTATMGDAAFLLIAAKPLTGLGLMALCFTTGVVTGVIVNALHGTDFLRPQKPFAYSEPHAYGASGGGWLEHLWLVLFIPGLALGILNALQVDIDAAIGSPLWPSPSITIGASGGILCLAMFLLPKFLKAPHATSPISAFGDLSHRVISDSNFVTAWVVLAFLLFELSVYFFAIDLAQVFDGYRVLTPMIAIVIGFIPGCGPQILVTSLYLAGAIPLSAQIGNAISNDGDALFPAIAVAPMAAIVATLYSAVPAVIIAYGWLIFVDGV